MSILTRLSGVTFGQAQQHINNLDKSDFQNISLVREHNNPFDSNAIKVVFGNYHLGYIPKQIAANLAPRIDSGEYFNIEYVAKNTCSYNDVVGLTIKISSR